MNFLDICKRVDTMSGVQGHIDSVSNTIGAQAVIVNGVVEGFIELQDDRLNWEWMVRTVQFGAIPDQQEYAVDDIFQATLLSQATTTFDPTAEYLAFGRWRRDNPSTSHYIEKYDDDGNRMYRHRLVYLRHDHFRARFNDSQSTGQPAYMTYRPDTNAILLHPVPDSRYFILADYYVQPQLLAHNSEIPILPAPFHLMLVYGGLDRLANHYSNPSIYNRYALAHAKMTGSLYREHVPGESVQINPVA